MLPRLLALVSEEQGQETHAETATRLAGAHAADDSAREDRSARAPAEATAGAGFLIVRAGEGAWRPTADAGVRIKLLFVDRERATVTTLVRMEPGARIPAHRHLGLEQCLVLEGDLRSGGIEMSAGDFNCSMPWSTGRMER